MITASLGEELGWRGFAYQRLLASMSPLRASLQVGVVWALWHLPTAFYAPEPSALAFALFVVQATAASVLIAWLMERGGRRTIIAIAFHAGNYLTLFQRPRTTAVLLVQTAIAVTLAALAGLALYRQSRVPGKPHPCLGRVPELGGDSLSG